MKKIIVWEPDDIPSDEEIEKVVLEDEQDESDEVIGENEAEITSEDGRKIRVKVPKSQQMIHTNFGSFLQYHPDNPYNTRDVWIAHTNFNLTDNHFKDIMSVPGVEAFRGLTRYSFTVIIGMVFYAPDVLNEIDDVLGIEKKANPQTQKKVDANQELIDATISAIKGDYWYCYIMPNGETVTEVYETVELMAERTEFFDALNSISGGLILVSEKRPPEPEKEEE